MRVNYARNDVKRDLLYATVISTNISEKWKHNKHSVAMFWLIEFYEEKQEQIRGGAGSIDTVVTHYPYSDYLF